MHGRGAGIRARRDRDRAAARRRLAGRPDIRQYMLAGGEAGTDARTGTRAQGRMRRPPPPPAGTTEGGTQRHRAQRVLVVTVLVRASEVARGAREPQ